MERRVISLTFKNYQVLNVVITLLSIDVVNYFFFGKVSSKIPFANKSMLSNHSTLFTKRMRGDIFKNISPFVFCNSIVVKVIVFSRTMRTFFAFVPRNIYFFIHGRITLVETFTRTTFLFFVISRKFFATLQTYFYHSYLQIKKAAFGVLEKTRLNVFHLLTALNLHKKIVLPLTNNSIAFNF